MGAGKKRRGICHEVKLWCHLFIVLSNEGLGTHDYLGDVAVLVQDVDVVVGRNAVDAFRLRVLLSPIHLGLGLHAGGERGGARERRHKWRSGLSEGD